MPIKILIDSASDISRVEAQKMGIEMVSLRVSFEKEEYYDGVDLLPEQFYEKLIETDIMPKTSQVNPYQFSEVYEKLVNEGNQVLVITLSSKLSNTYNSAVVASQEYKDKVFVVDSLNVAVGERLLCEYALRLIDKGLTIKEIVDELNLQKKKINLIAVVDTLKYLQKGGRISKIAAFAGTILSLKPVLAIVDGEVKMLGKARGSKKANNLLVELIQKKGGIDFNKPFGTLYSGLSDVEIKKYIKDHTYLWENDANEVPIHIIGSTIGTHIGPGVVGVAFFNK